MRSLLLFAAALFLPLAAARPAAAGLGPENVAVVVNAGSHSSRTIANAFVHGRGIPVDNIIYLSDVSGFEHISVDDFRESLLKPVLKTIEERGLTPQIDCIAWSSDFPYAVDVQSDIAAAGLKLPQVFTPTASINGLTFLYELVLAKDPRYLELNSNWYYRKTSIKGRKPQDVKPPTDDERARFRDAMKLVQEKKWDKAAEALAELAKSRPEEAPLQYNLACALAQTGKADEAMKALTAAVDAGWSDRDHVEKDEDLKSLRERDDYKALLPKIVPSRFEVEPTVGFRSFYRWNERGERVEAGGRKYLLSVMLAVTSGRGTSIDSAAGQFHRSRDAEDLAEIVDGTFYFLKNGDVRARTREWAFESAAEQLRSMGRKAEVIDGTIPQNKEDVAGAVVGIADFDWPGSASKILPGAIVEHLTSFGGVLREHSGQTPFTAFLKAGAAGSSGTVTEPFAIQAKFPTAFLHVHYARGATLAEAFYASVQGPYQLLIVGDPLCQPFHHLPNFDIEESMDGEKYRFRPISKGDATLPERFEFFVDGKRAGTCSRGEAWVFDPGVPLLGMRRIKVQGVAEGPLEIRSMNRGHSIVFASDEARRVHLRVHERDKNPILQNRKRLKLTGAETLRIDGECPAATTITIRAQGEPIAEIAGYAGHVGIPASGLGLCELEIDAVAETPGGLIRSHTVPIYVTKPAASIPESAEFEKLSLSDGLLLRVEDREPVIISDTRDPNWLAAQKLAAGVEFTLEGIFSQEDSNAVAAIQTSGNCREQILVDATRVNELAPGVWRYRMLELAKGRHMLRVIGRIPEDAQASPQLSIRYGVEGTQSLDGKRFQHEMK